jgi:hypothetical protein
MGSFASIALSALAILACGLVGAVAGYTVVTTIGWAGTPAAILAAGVGMSVATLAFALGVAALRWFGWLR